MAGQADSSPSLGGPRGMGWLPTALLVGGLALVWLGERMLGTGTPRVACSAAGALVFALALGLRIRGYVRAIGDQRSVELRLLWAYAGVLVGLLLYALSTDAAIEAMGLKGTSAERLAGALAAAWPTVVLVSLSAAGFMELVYARMPVPASVELRRVRLAAQIGLTLALAVVFVVSINYVAAERDVRKDFSYFKTTRPGEATRQMVSQLDTPVRILLFYPKANDVLAQLRPYFDELAALSDRLRVEVVDHALAPELARTHRVRGNGFVLLLGEAEGAGAAGSAAAAQDGPEPDAAPPAQSESLEVGVDLEAARAALRSLDGRFQRALTKLTLPPRKLFLTVGHGERNAKATEGQAGDGARRIDALLERLNVQTQSLGMAQGLAHVVPESASAVAVIGPQEPFLVEEAQALLKYAQGGGRLILMLDPGLDHGLQPLLEGLGLRLREGVLASQRHHMRRSFTPADREIVYANRYSSHAAVTTLNRHAREVATVFFRGAALEKVGGDTQAKVSFPLRSAGDFWLDLDGDREKGADEPSGTMNLVAAVELPRAEGEAGRALVIGDGDAVSDKLIGNAGNSLLFVDALAWLIGEEKIVGEVASEEDVPIEHTQEEDKLWFYGTTFAVPLPVLGLGLWMLRRRRRRGARSGAASAGAAQAGASAQKAGETAGQEEPG